MIIIMSENSGSFEIGRAKTPLQFARNVNKTMTAIENDSGIKIPPEKKRAIIRHEVAHAIGAGSSAESYDVSGRYLKSLHGGQQDTNIAIGANVTLSGKSDSEVGLAQMRQAVAPRGDKRFKQELSLADKKSFLAGLLRFLHIKL